MDRPPNPCPSLTPLLNPHQASRTAGALPTANSLPWRFSNAGRFAACTDDRHRHIAKTCTCKTNSCAPTKTGEKSEAKTATEQLAT